LTNLVDLELLDGTTVVVNPEYFIMAAKQLDGNWTVQVQGAILKMSAREFMRFVAAAFKAFTFSKDRRVKFIE
jgi:hypothetical protein